MQKTEKKSLSKEKRCFVKQTLNTNIESHYVDYLRVLSSTSAKLLAKSDREQIENIELEYLSPKS